MHRGGNYSSGIPRGERVTQGYGAAAEGVSELPCERARDGAAAATATAGGLLSASSITP